MHSDHFLHSNCFSRSVLFLQVRVFFDMSDCEGCNKMLGQGLRCRNCNKKCHKACQHKVNNYCSPTGRHTPEKQSHARRHEELWKE